jgi:uncharacterized delta-60 repeat protein
MKKLHLFGVVGVALAALVFTGALSAAAGDLDRTFDGDGIVVTDFEAGSYDVAWGLAVQRDGKVVLAGETQSATNNSFALVRYDAKGALDGTFDGDGKVRTDFTPTSSEEADAVALQPDGKIVAAGFVAIPGSGTSLDFALVRYNADGALDPSFDGDGKVVTNFGSGHDWALAVEVQADGKIVAAGMSRPPGSGPFSFAVARYNADGSLDSTFDGDGRVVTPIAGNPSYTARDIALQADGKLLVGGSPQNGIGGVLVRYTPAGAIDATFDGDGIVTTAASGFERVAVQKDGKILAAGTSSLGILRIDPDGSVDSSFGENGVASAPGSSSAFSTGVAVQPDGKIVAGGIGAAGHDFAVARFKPNGDPDTTFGSGESVKSVVGGPGGSDESSELQIAPDGKIVLAGGSRTTESGPFDFAAVRYLGDSKCKVPNVRGKKLAAAKSSIKKARCAIGKVKRKASKPAKKGRVLAQSPRPGATVSSGTKVNLVIGKGRRKR